MRANVVKQIRQYHGVVTNADKTIADAGQEQIRAAYKCGELLGREKAKVRSGHWGRFCKECGISEDTAGRYIKLSKSADLRELIQKYRTLNAAYQGEEITSARRQPIPIISIGTAPPDSGVKPIVAHQSKGEGTNGGGKVDSTPSNGDGHNGIDLKAKVKGGGTLGDLLNKVSPAVRADIESQLHGAANGGRVLSATTSTVAPVEESGSESTSPRRLIDPLEIGGEEIAGLFQGPVLIDALLLQLKHCAETEDPVEIDACVSYLKPIVSWYEKYAATVEALAE